MSDKSKKLKILETLLRWMTVVVLCRHKPKVIGITGSVGKTSAKEAIFHVLSGHECVRQTQKNYNNEIGLPLEIIGASNGERSLLKWLMVALKWISALFSFRYPKVLILEFGIDHPGDMDYLLSFIPVHIGIVTNIPKIPVHVEFFKNAAHLVKEKQKLVSAVPQDGMVILDADSVYTRDMEKNVSQEMLLYGCEEGASVRAVEIIPSYKDDVFSGLSFKVEYDGKIVPVRLHHIVARHHISAALAAIAAGISFKMNLVDIAQKLESFLPPIARMRRIDGMHGSVIIDDTYNASPEATHAAIETLLEVPADRRIAILGDMRELGEASERAHIAVAEDLLEKKVDVFFAVGPEMEAAYRHARENGYDEEHAFYFEDPELAGQKMKEIIQRGDVVLVKGSQWGRMERAVKEIMAEPEEAEELLCRQSNEWLAKE